MEHVVFSAAEQGAGEEFRRVANLDEAVRVVERLRNDLGITDASVYALTPVPLEFRTYYRVELPGAASPEIPAGSEVMFDEPAMEAPLPAQSLYAASAAAPSASFGGAELTDMEVLPDFDGSELPVPSLLPAAMTAATIPSTRQDSDAERSLGYFAR